MRAALFAVPGSVSGHDSSNLLADRAEQWLGRSAVGNTVTVSTPLGWTRPSVDAITVDARRYGFHATLKAPFTLNADRSLDDLVRSTAAFAAAHPAVVIPKLTLACIDSFFALVPGKSAEPLLALAAEIVTIFDEFRAAPDATDLRRRNIAGMTNRQRELFELWGYPYVLDQYRFHMTLTDRIATKHQAAVEGVLTGWFAEYLGADIPVTGLAVFTERERGASFLLHSVHALQPILEPVTSIKRDSE
jgi:hypothetical protein